MTSEIDTELRTAAFQFVANLQETFGDEIPWSLLLRGFDFRGERVSLVGAGGQGIFKPRILDLPLSITTTPIVEGRERPYDDAVHEHGLISYRYRGTDPNFHANVELRSMRATQTPLIYFHGVARGLYAAAFPAYVISDRPSRLTFTIAVDEYLIDTSEEPFVEDPAARRAYVTRAVLNRLHQQGFRQRVMQAYSETCAVCQLRQRSLLDAAHILPDRDPRSEPVVSSGIALCRLHHAAFDTDIVGITPDYQIHVRADVLSQADGPMLVHGLQGFHGKSLSVPRSEEQRPNREFLAERYERFNKAS
jgi:putative restriction endonuclease